MTLIYLYNIINILLTPVYLLIFIVRIIKGKDNYLSLKQRFSITNQKRPSGKLIWFHAASVGESVMAITLIKAITRTSSEYNFLVTTATLSSSNILEKSLPKCAIHQFVPIDNILFIRNFLKHWQPDLGIFIESEIWPCLITRSSNMFDLLLINAKLSDKSYTRWSKHKKLFGLIINSFKKIITQSELDLYKFQQLSARKAINLGNLKFANKKLEIDQSLLGAFKKLFVDKKILVCASTHREDEDILLKIIANLKSKIDYFPILIPRHPNRREEIADQCTKLNLKFSMSSIEQVPSPEDDLFIADSFGKLGTFYSLADIVFVGGSFAQGGHNIFEPAYFDNVILIGPDMSGSKNIVAEMLERMAVIQVKDDDELELKIKFFFNKDNIDIANNYRKNAFDYVENNQDILANYLQEINRYLP